jgi:hypothetical protein
MKFAFIDESVRRAVDWSLETGLVPGKEMIVIKAISAQAVLGALLGLAMIGGAAAADVTLLNVSYDPTRELYADINKAFTKEFTAATGKTIEIKQSHGGSGKQARSVIDGLPADRVPGPQGQSQGDQGLGRSRQVRLLGYFSAHPGTMRPRSEIASTS